MLFPIADYWFIYLVLLVFLILSIGIDLAVGKDKLSQRVALTRVLFYISMGLGLSGAIYYYAATIYPQEIARQLMLEYLTGYLIEQSLSVDNLFVFIVIFKFFHIKLEDQRLILMYGIIGAVVMRGIFIAIGTTLIQYSFMEIIFGVFLIITGIRMLKAGEEDEDLSKRRIYQFMRKYLPLSKHRYPHKFWVKEDGRWKATTLLVALLLIEISDVIFAVDSVPAILAISREPFIVFSSNVMALMGLRSLYMVVNQLLLNFRYLKYGLSVILVFIGLKMAWLNHYFPISLSIFIILGILGISMLASAIANFLEKRAKATTD